MRINPPNRKKNENGDVNLKVSTHAYVQFDRTQREFWLMGVGEGAWSENVGGQVGEVK